MKLILIVISTRTYLYLAYRATACVMTVASMTLFVLIAFNRTLVLLSALHRKEHRNINCALGKIFVSIMVMYVLCDISNTKKNVNYTYCASHIF